MPAKNDPKLLKPLAERKRKYALAVKEGLSDVWVPFGDLTLEERLAVKFPKVKAKKQYPYVEDA